jgi:hypothetical protein
MARSCEVPKSLHQPGQHGSFISVVAAAREHVKRRSEADCRSPANVSATPGISNSRRFRSFPLFPLWSAAVVDRTREATLIGSVFQGLCALSVISLPVRFSPA